MNAIDREGRYKAVVVDYALGETKESKIPQFAIEFSATHFWVNGQWEDWTPYQASIRGYFFPFKKEGEPNESTIESLMKALGWDGLSLESLEKGQYAGREVQIVVKEETYNGKTKLKVSWLDPGDHELTLRKMDTKEVQAMSMSWDAKLRAMNGGKKASPPKAPARAQAG